MYVETTNIVIQIKYISFMYFIYDGSHGQMVKITYGKFLLDIFWHNLSNSELNLK